MSHIRLAKHKQFGVSSEQTDGTQMSIFNEAESSSDMITPEPELTEVKTHYRKRTRLTTDKLPQDLPVEVIEHELPAKDCVCPDCGSKLHTIWKFQIIVQNATSSHLLLDEKIGFLPTHQTVQRLALFITALL